MHAEEDKELLGHLMWVAGEVARDLGLDETFQTCYKQWS